MLLHKTLSLKQSELQSSDSGTFRGYASVFGGIDSYGDTILPGAFSEAIAAKTPKLFYAHDWTLPIGKWTAIQEDEKGLLVEGELTPGLALANDVGAALRHGTVDGLSIGGYLKKGDYTESENGRVIHRWSDLMEISIVPFPADDKARIDDAKADIISAIDAVETIRDFERLLRDVCGLSKSAAVKTVAKAKELISRRDADKSELAQLIDRLHKFGAKS